MSLSRLTGRLPSFTLVLMSPPQAPGEEGKALVILQDGQAARSRTVRLSLPAPPPPRAPRSLAEPGDPLMTTVDTRFSGDLEYGVVYNLQKDDESVHKDEGAVDDAVGTGETELQGPSGGEARPGAAAHPALVPGRPRAPALRRYLAIRTMQKMWHKVRRACAVVFCGTIQ